MLKNLHCSIGLINSDNLLIFKFRNFKFDLKYNFVNNLKNSNACRFLNSYVLKWYEVRRLEKLFRGSNFIQKFVPSYKNGVIVKKRNRKKKELDSSCSSSNRSSRAEAILRRKKAEQNLQNNTAGFLANILNFFFGKLNKKKF